CGGLALPDFDSWQGGGNRTLHRPLRCHRGPHGWHCAARPRHQHAAVVPDRLHAHRGGPDRLGAALTAVLSPFQELSTRRHPSRMTAATGLLRAPRSTEETQAMLSRSAFWIAAFALALSG